MRSTDDPASLSPDERLAELPGTFGTSGAQTNGIKLTRYLRSVSLPIHSPESSDSFSTLGTYSISFAPLRLPSD